MKRIMTITCLVVVIAGCGDVRLVPITGEYQKTSFRYNDNQLFDHTWEQVLDFLQQKKIAVENSDKNSGIITTAKISFVNSYTFETNEGYLKNPSAYVVCGKLRGPMTIGLSLDLQDVTGQWQFRIKKNDTGSIVEVALTNATALASGIDLSQYAKRKDRPLDPGLVVQSTGVFEKEVQTAIR